MSNPYIGEIRIFASTFAPVGWALCNGAEMSIAQNDVLFNLIGTTYGGDGENTFALPNLGGRLPVHQGQGPGISQTYVIGESGGVESVTLTTQQLPNHNHAALSSSVGGNTPSPAGAVWANFTDKSFYSTTATPAAAMNPAIVSPVGGSQPHENMMPYLVINFIIALFGLYPPPQ